MTWRDAAVERGHFLLADAADVQQLSFVWMKCCRETSEPQFCIAHFVVFCRTKSNVNRPFLATRFSSNRALPV
jgi:hypothetical protein